MTRMLLFLIATLLHVFATETKAQVTRCQGSDKLLDLNFEDIQQDGRAGNYAGLPIPYQGFNLVTDRQPTSIVPVYPALLKNTSNSTSEAYFVSSATSPPNMIFTDGHGLILTFSSSVQSQKAFTLLSFTVTSIYADNMLVTIMTSRNGNVISSNDVSLPFGVPVTILVGQSNIDRLYVSCAAGLLSCSHMGFDSFKICH